MSHIRAVFEDGFSWVEIDDEAWEHATLTEYLGGMELDLRRYM